MFDRDSMAGREDVMMLGLSGFDEFEIGQHLDDFELVLELGHGAFARVFLARQLSMQRWVALKISRNIGVEPQTLAQLDHPNIVRVFDQRLLEERALRVLFMEYVPGGTLLDVVKLVRVTPQAQRSGQLLLDAIDKTLAKKGEMKPSETSLRSEIAAMSWPETVAWMGGCDWPMPSSMRVSTAYYIGTSSRRMSCSASKASPPSSPTSTSARARRSRPRTLHVLSEARLPTCLRSNWRPVRWGRLAHSTPVATSMHWA